MRGRSPQKAFPLGGRWHGEAVTDEGAISPKSLPLGGKVPPKGADEGAMIERFFVGPDAHIGPLDGSFRREFRRLRAASDFPNDGKVTKGSPGDAADGHFVPIGPLTPGPPLRGLPLWLGVGFPARKI